MVMRIDVMKKLVTLFCLICLLGLMIGPSTAWAAGATIIFAPGSLTMTPGSQASTTVMIASDVTFNSLDLYITFPASIMSVTGVDTSGSDFNIVLTKREDNSAGTIHFTMSSTTPGGLTTTKLATVTFQAKSEGSGSLGLKPNGQVVAADGHGTSIPVTSGGAAVQVQAVQAATPTPTPQVNHPVATPAPTFRPATTDAPQISSTTHPDQEHWYTNRTVTLNWNGGGQAYNVAFDQSATTQLPDQSAGPMTTTTTTLAGDGVWYGHVKSLGSAGWSATSHYKLQVDTVGPVAFTATTDPLGDTGILPKVIFATTDATSGIDHYEIRMDNDEWMSATSPYALTKGKTGQHTVQVKAIDKAGNTAVAEVKFNLLAPDAPVITSPANKQLFMLGQLVDVQGKAAPKTMVDLFLNDKKLETVLTDAAGNFQATKSLLLFAGAYKLVAKAISPEGIASSPSAAINLTIDARAVKLFGAVWPGWVVLVGAIILFLLLAFAVGGLAHRVWRLGKAWVKRVGVLQGAVRTDLEQLEKTVDAKVDAVLTANTPEAEQVKAEVAQAVAVAGQHLQTVSSEMLVPEPWLPILHGKERFSLAKEENKTVSQQQAAVSATSPVADAEVIFGTTQEDATKAEGKSSTVQSPVAPITPPAEPIPLPTPLSDEDKKAPSPVIAPLSPITPIAPTAPAESDQITVIQPAPAIPMTPATPSPVAEKIDGPTDIEVKAEIASVPTIDLLAPTIEEIAPKTDTDTKK
jgi:hypothetical protein